MSINSDVPLQDLGLQDVVREVPDDQIPAPYVPTEADIDTIDAREEMPLDTHEIVPNALSPTPATNDTDEHVSTLTDEMRTR